MSSSRISFIVSLLWVVITVKTTQGFRQVTPPNHQQHKASTQARTTTSINQPVAHPNDAMEDVPSTITGAVDTLTRMIENLNSPQVRLKARQFQAKVLDEGAKQLKSKVDQVKTQVEIATDGAKQLQKRLEAQMATTTTHAAVALASAENAFGRGQEAGLKAIHEVLAAYGIDEEGIMPRSPRMFALAHQPSPPGTMPQATTASAGKILGTLQEDVDTTTTRKIYPKFIGR